MAPTPEAMVCASCPEVIHDRVSELCRRHGIQKAFGKAGDMVNSLSGKDWVPKWEAKVVMATVTKAQTMGVNKALILCIAGGKNCDAEMARQPHLVRAIKKEIEDPDFRVRVEWVEKEEFFERFDNAAAPGGEGCAGKGGAAAGKAESGGAKGGKAGKAAGRGGAPGRASEGAPPSGDKQHPPAKPPQKDSKAEKAVGAADKGGPGGSSGGAKAGKGDAKPEKGGAKAPGAGQQQQQQQQQQRQQQQQQQGASQGKGKAQDKDPRPKGKAGGKAQDKDPRPSGKGGQGGQPAAGRSAAEKQSKMCKFFAQGQCRNGAACQFVHALDGLDEDEDTWCCEQCGKEFDDPKSCADHMLMMGHGNVPVCLGCNKLFGSKQAVNQHQDDTGHVGIIWEIDIDLGGGHCTPLPKSRQPEVPMSFQCMCGRAFATEPAMHQHMLATGHSSGSGISSVLVFP